MSEHSESNPTTSAANVSSNPLLNAANLLTAYVAAGTFTDKERHIANEAIARLKTEARRYEAVMNENRDLLESSEQFKQIREVTTPENLKSLLATSKDPAIAALLGPDGGQLRIVQRSTLTVRDMSHVKADSDEEAERITTLYSDTEAIYHSLWVVKSRLNQLSKFKNFNPPGVRDVRNHLIEHTDNPKSSDAYIYSFGTSSSGPVLRPIKPTGVKAPNDVGLASNVEAFATAIERTLKK